MIEIRVARPALGATQGHYFEAGTYDEAVALAQKKFPNETLVVRTFKVMIDGIKILVRCI